MYVIASYPVDSVTAVMVVEFGCARTIVKGLTPPTTVRPHASHVFKGWVVTFAVIAAAEDFNPEVHDVSSPPTRPH